MTRQAPSKVPAKAAAKAANGRAPVHEKNKPVAPEVFEPPEDEDDTDVPDELEEETGLDLSDASDLDADNVIADEESERVLRAPD